MRGAGVGEGSSERRARDTCIIGANTLDLICYSEDNHLKLGGSGEGGREEELRKKGGEEV